MAVSNMFDALRDSDIAEDLKSAKRAIDNAMVTNVHDSHLGNVDIMATIQMSLQVAVEQINHALSLLKQ